MARVAIISACRCVERAIGRIQDPGEKPTLATLRRWELTIDTETWGFVLADFGHRAGDPDFEELMKIALSVQCLHAARHATDAQLDAEEADARRRGREIDLGLNDMIRQLRGSVDARRKERAGIRDALRQVSGQTLLCFALHAHRNAIRWKR